MNREIVWTWAAEADMQGIFAAAEDAADGTGVSFLGQVEKASTLLLNFPRMAPAWRDPDSIWNEIRSRIP